VEPQRVQTGRIDDRCRVCRSVGHVMTMPVV